MKQKDKHVASQAFDFEADRKICTCKVRSDNFNPFNQIFSLRITDGLLLKKVRLF